MRNLLGGKGANLAEMAVDRPAGAARLHHHHRGLHRLLRQQPHLPGRPEGPGRRRSRRIETGVGLNFGDQAQSAAGLGPLRRARVDARHDGHGAQPRPERRDRRGPRRGRRRSALRLGLLSPLHPDVRPRRARRRPPPVRGDHRARQARRRRDRGHRTDRAGLAARRRRLQGDGPRGNRQAVPAGSAGAALGRHRRGVRQLDEPARHHLSPAARHPRRLGHRGQRAGDGVRQHGRGLRHRRLLHPRSRPPARTCSTASTW